MSESQKKRTTITRDDRFRTKIKRKTTNSENDNNNCDGVNDRLTDSQSDSPRNLNGVESASIQAEGEIQSTSRIPNLEDLSLDDSDYHPNKTAAKEAFRTNRKICESLDKYGEGPEDEFDDLDDSDEWDDYKDDDGIEDLDEDQIGGYGDLQRQESTAETRVHNICREILSTEERYVSRLFDLVVIYKRTGAMINVRLAASMFPKIESIHQLHCDFLPCLRERINNWTPESELGDLMMKMTPFLKIYTDYVKNFQTASQLVQLWKGKHVGFNKLLAEYMNKKWGGMEIGGLMIEPIQRVPRYELLMKDYIKRLPSDSPDIPNVKRSLEKVSEAAKHFETMMKRDAKIAALGALQRSIDSSVNIFSFSRVLVRNDCVKVFNQKLDKNEPCALYLFNDMLLITREVHHMGSTRKKAKYIIELPKARVHKQLTSLELVVSTRKSEVHITFSTLDVTISWEQDLRHQIAESTKKKLIRRGTWQEANKTLGETAPRMVLPHTVSVCMACGLQFDTQKRKKNCAACGMVVCAKCSPHQMLLPYDRTDVKRVCHTCHTTMNQKSRSISVS